MYVCVERTYFTYIFSGGGAGETEIGRDLGFEYAVLPQVGVVAICCLCNLSEKEREKNRRKEHEVGES